MIYLTDYVFANETEDNSFKIFNMITAINESRSLIKGIFCDIKCRFDVKCD